MAILLISMNIPRISQFVSNSKFSLSALLILGVGLALTITVSQNNQEQRSRASGEGIAYIQSTNGSCNNCTSKSLSFSSSVTAGHTIIVAISDYDGRSYTVRDTKGNTYNLATRLNSNASGGINIYYADNVTGGSTTVIVTPSSSTDLNLGIHEYSGLSIMGSFDKGNASHGSSSNVTSGNTATTTEAQELVFGAYGYSTISYSTSTPGPGFTARINDGNGKTQEPLLTQDKIVSATGAYNATWTNSLSSSTTYSSSGYSSGSSYSSGLSYWAAVATFKALATPPTAYPTPTNTPYPTSTPVPPTATNIPAQPTATYMPAQPTPTYTPVQPTATNVPYQPTPTNTPVPTYMPTSTPVPTATPYPGAASLYFTLLLHGLGKGGDSVNPVGQGNMTPIHPQRVVTVDIYDTHNSLIQTKQGIVIFDSASGSFKGTIDLGIGFSTGIYSVKVKTGQFLRSLVPGIQSLTAGLLTQMPETVLVTGDVDDNNVVNILDYNLLMGCYSDLSPAVDCTADNKVRADLTDDGAVNQFDYNLFLRELTTKGGE